MIAPSPRQLRILRLLAAGVELRPGDRTQAHLVLDGRLAGIVRTSTVTALRECGFVTPLTAAKRYELTPLGRSHAETHTFVRAFCDAVAPRAD